MLRVQLIRWFLNGLLILEVLVLSLSAILNIVTGQLHMAVRMSLFFAAFDISAVHCLRHEREYERLLSGAKTSKIPFSKPSSAMSLLLAGLAIFLPS